MNNKLKVAVFITVRTGSSRLPNKAILEIKGKPIIEHLIDWIKRAKNLDDIVLCTTENPEDKILIEVAERKGIKWFRGSENDIMKRHLDAANYHDIDFIINVEGDSIFYPSEYIDIMTIMVRENNSFYDVIFTFEDTNKDNNLPFGVNIFGYKRSSLKKIINKSSETGWGEIIRKEPSFSKGFISILPAHKIKARLTLDYQEDFDLFQAIYKHFDTLDFDLTDIVSLLKKKPELIEINEDCEEMFYRNYNRKRLNFLVIGLGSMGKRRIRNLKALGMKNIIGYDISESRRNEVDIRTYSLLSDAMIYNPNVFIISVPPDQHLFYQAFANANKIPFFTEASVISNGLDHLIKNTKENEVIGIPSSTMRFHPAIKKIKELVDTDVIGYPLTFTYHSGSYLPNWHPEDDPKTYYAYDKKQGAAKEIVPFELSWLTWIFGNIKSTKAYYKESMGWEIDDIYQVLIEFESGVIGHLLVDVVSLYDYRQFKVLGSEGIINWDWDLNGISILKEYDWTFIEFEKGTSIEGYNENIIEEMYIDELDHFINCILDLEEPQYTLEDDLKILKILDDIEKDGSME